MEMLLTVDQVAEKLQMKPNAVRVWLKSGRLRGVKRGRLWRVPESALIERTPSVSPLWEALRLSEEFRASLGSHKRPLQDAAEDVRANRSERGLELEGRCD